jgi:hypothetical protein
MTTKKWVQDPNGYLLCVYQTEEDGYHARSFEDAFFHINRQFFLDNIDKFPMGIKNKNHISDMSKDVYFLAENCVKKKPALAMEVLLNSKTYTIKDFLYELQWTEATSITLKVNKFNKVGYQFSNWKIPTYIKEGLLWLKED